MTGQETSGMALVSFTRDEVEAIKRGVTHNRPYWNRISLGFAARLVQLANDLREGHYVLDELDHLEGLRPCPRTKPAEPFKRPPLDVFWHQHFTAPRHLLRNLGERWGLRHGGNGDLQAMIEKVAKQYGHDPALWQQMIPYEFTVVGYRERTDRGLTGDWIIFAKHEGRNYYLDLATHEEGSDPERLYEKLRNGSAAEFPFAFGMHSR